MRIPLKTGYKLILETENTKEVITIKEVIGEGGCCIAYKGDLQKGVPVPVVVKECFPLNLSLKRDEKNQSIIPENDEQSEDILQDFDYRKDRFRNGLMTAMMVNRNDNSNSIFTYAEKNNTVYGFSDYKKGEILTDYIKIRKDDLSIADIADLIISICKVIQQWHKNRYVYLDCKPDNIFITEEKDENGRPIANVIDFDSVILLQKSDKPLNNPLTYSRGWAAPEQLEIGKKLSFKTDVFSIAAVFFWALTGKKPYKTTNQRVPLANIDFKILSQIQDGSFDWRKESKICALADQRIIDLIKTITKKALAENPTDRSYGSSDKELEEMILDLEYLSNIARKSGNFLSENDGRLKANVNRRFMYNSRSTHLRGREQEIERLTDMCNSDDYFSWIGICGSGGTGKSKLAYELCHQMSNQYWQVYTPRSFDAIPPTLLDNQGNNILICIDYVKHNMQQIAKFIKTNIIERQDEHKYKIRILLLERDEADLHIEDVDNNLIHYCYGDPISLTPLTTDHIKNIVFDYYRSQKCAKPITEDSLNIITDTLGTVDKEFRRPVYALFIADAWINNENLMHWDRNDALNFLLNRELIRLKSIIKNTLEESYSPFTSIADQPEQEDYIQAVTYLYALATYMGSIQISDYYDKLEEIFGIRSYDKKLLKILKNCGMLYDSSIILGWEPDLIGEYFCIRYLDNLTDNNSVNIDARLFIQTMTNNNLESYIKYSEMIFKDFPDLVCNSTWEKAMRNITFPEKYKHVVNSMFENCQFITGISFPGRVYTFGANSFANCINLQGITLPSSLEIIERNAFNGCKKLSFVIPLDGQGMTQSVIRIESRAFLNCENLSEIYIPDSVLEIGVSAFENCKSIELIKLPSSLKSLEERAFAGCISLTKLFGYYFKSEELQIPDFCFAGCEQLSDTIINWNQITSIGKSAFKNCKGLIKISLGKKLTSIGVNAFVGCISLSCIDMSNCSIDNIPAYAFSDCTSLDDITLPETIIRIEDNCFSGCKNLKTVSFNEGLIGIGYRAFSGCEEITHLSTPNSLSYIGRYAFENCNTLSEIRFGSSPNVIEGQAFAGCDALEYSNIYGLNTDQNKWFCGFAFSSFTEPDFNFVKRLSTEKHIIIPDTVISIGNDCFCENKNVVSIEIPSSVVSIGKSAFRDCINLQYVQCRDNSIRSIHQKAFAGCTSLKKIDGNLAINYISESAFQDCISLETLSFSAIIESIGEKAFWGCKKLIGLQNIFQSIPNIIESGAFTGCESMPYPLDISLFNSSEYRPDQYWFEGFKFSRITDIELKFLKNLQKKEVIRIPDSCVDLLNAKFCNIKKLRKIILPESIASLPQDIFKDCTTLETVVLPSKIKTIPKNAFANCRLLKNVIFRGNRINIIPTGVDIREGAFSGCFSLERICLPKSLTRICEYTFSNCTSLKEINIPSKVKIIKSNAFLNCRSLTTIKLPDKLERLGISVFSGCVSLSRILNFENTKITWLLKNTFDNCENIETLSLPKKLERIYGQTFKNCRKLSVPVSFIPDSVTFIGAAAFQGCSEIKKLRIPCRINEIRDYTFKECYSLKEIIMPNRITKIGQSAFYNCNNLIIRENSLPKELQSLGICAFAYCNSLTKITIPDGITELPQGLFKGCASLKTVHIPDHITMIPADCFKDCIALEEINFPANLIGLDVGCFRNCCSLTSDKLKLPEGLLYIRETAFRYCDSLETITIPCKIANIPSDAFEGCKNLIEVNFSHHINEVGHYAFFDCAKLIRFPFRLIDKKINDGAFCYCKSLSDLSFSDSISSIGPAAFRGCCSIKELKIPQSIHTISGASFRENENLESVFLPDSVTLVKKSAFRDCINLSNVEIYSHELELGHRVFMNCSSLYYLQVPGKMIVHSDTFESCPAEESLKDNDRIIWCTSES